MRLQQKILLIILPLILVPILVLGLITYHYVDNVKVNLESAKLQSDIVHRVNEVNTFTSNISSALIYLSHNHFLHLATLGNQKESYSEIEAVFSEFSQAYQDTVSISLLDKNGEKLLGVVTHPEHLMAVKEVKNIPLSTNWQFVPIGFEKMPLIKILWAIKHDIKDINSSTIGFIELVMKPDLVQYLKLNEELGDKLLISDMRGQLLFSFPQGELGGTIPDYLFTKLLSTVQKKETINIKLGSQEIFMSGQMLSDKYLLLFGQNKKQDEVSENDITWVLIVIIFSSMIAASVLIYFSVKRFVTEPIEQLAQAKQGVAQGNLDVKLDINTKDEFGELFAAFNIMVRQLIVYREKERDSRLRLEYKVRERTEELEIINSELEDINTKLEQANQLKSTFVANMSHEIRTPLTAILGFTEQVIADSSSNKQQLNLLGRVLKSGKHLLSLINDILDLSKIEARRLEIEVTEVNLFDLLNEVISLMSNQAADSNLHFDCHYHYPLPTYIKSDETRLKQVLLNLISNAIKFTESGSVIVDVSFQPLMSQVEIKVSDTGIGMSEKELSYIFEPFTQADVSISRRFGGTGLGLVISRSLANLLGGDIRVTSQEKQGSEFTFSFDVSAGKEEFEYTLVNSLVEIASNSNSYMTESNALEPKIKEQTMELSGRVLVAEDVEDNQYLLRLLLKSFNVEVVMVDNGEKAVEKAMEQDFDLILMDMQMPVMGGLEATELLRAAGVDAPIYALTANVMREDIEKHLEAGCNGTIAKPIEKEDLNQIVRSVLNDKVDESIISAAKMAELRQKYVTRLSSQVNLLNDMLMARNSEGLKSEAHKIKGSAGNYGFMTLSKKADIVEKACIENIKGALDWSELEPEVNEIITMINEICHNETD